MWNNIDGIKEFDPSIPPWERRRSRGTDGFHVPTQPYVQQQQPNQPGNQAQTLRGIAPNGPPNQPSTPPTNDLKVSQVQQQQSMNHMVSIGPSSDNWYVTPQQQVRGTQGAPYFRPPSQATRMPSQHRGQQQIYHQTQTQYVQMSVPPMYINTMQYYNGQQRPQTAFVQQAAPIVYQGQPLPSQFAFQPNPNQSAAVSFPPFFQLRPPQANTVPQNPAQPLQNIPLPPAQQQFQRQQNKRRSKAIPIIDPDTGVDRLDEVYEQQNSSHPPSGESSARQTPQPSINNANKDIAVAFAKQVAKVAASNDNSIDDQELLPGAIDHETLYHHQNSPIIPSHIDHIVQSSNLKAQAKEFVLGAPNTAKETPIVSANCDAVEVTLPNKQVKDRESPAKGRKQKEQQHREQHIDSGIDIPNRENVSDKESSNLNKSDNKPKESIINTVSVQSVAVASTSKDNIEVVTTHRDEKPKNQKKDSKTETKVPIDSTPENVNIPTTSQLQIVQEVSTNAKSKNSSRAKDVQKQQQQEKQQPISTPAVHQQQQKSSSVATVIPAPQPAKPSSKSSKKTEINQKGANKEGTDMDAFNDNVLLDNANINATNNEINANSVIMNENTEIPTIAAAMAGATTPTIQPPQPTSNIITTSTNETNKKHNVEISTFRTETKTFPNTKVDITDIVKEKPKPMKPFPAPTETQDEVDRVAPITNEKLVQVNNEANAKISTGNGNATISDVKPELPYKDGQWAPDNQDGKKVYDRDFLLALRNGPASRVKPTNLPEMIIADERNRSNDGRYASGGRTDFTNPPFPNYGGRPNSQRGISVSKRGSQSGKVGGGGGGKSIKQPNQIKLSLSLREEVKLHETENAWKPSRFNKNDMSEDDLKTEELYKKARGLLNKLTPQKFDTLVGQMADLNVDTIDRLQGLIELIFEKAVDEPNFSVAYATMCRHLAMMEVPINNGNGTEKKEVVNFRKVLVTRCQMEFEKTKVDDTRLEKVKEMNECTDPDKKNELQFELEEYDRKLRVKSVGNIRFIGELFKQQMLTVKIMMRCLEHLLEKRHEESLECLCKLLTTVGNELETRKIDLSSIFNTMADIIVEKKHKVSSRVRFMLQDVIDLRRQKWVPRRGDSNPKTIDQIQKDAENEQMNIQAMNSVPITPRKEERGGNHSNANTDRKRKNVSDDGWQTTSSSRNRTQFSVQSDKLKNKVPLTDEPLGNRQMFGNWSKGSNFKPEASASTSTNMYAALGEIDSDRRPSGSRGNSRDPYSSKGPSLDGNYNKLSSYDGRGSRSGSQHRSNDRDRDHIISQRNIPQPPITPSVQKQAPAPAPVEKMSQELLQRRMKNDLDEYLNDSCTIEEYIRNTDTLIAPADHPRLVEEGFLIILERSSTARIKTGSLFTKLIKIGYLSLDDYCAGVEDVLTQADELSIDIPMMWDYLAEIIVQTCDEVVSFSRLHKCCGTIIAQGHGAKFLTSLFKIFISEKGPNYLRSSWLSSGLSFEEFVIEKHMKSFHDENRLDSLFGGDTAAGQSQLLSYEQIHNKLVEFFNLKTSFDNVVNWITANVGDRVTENKFIRILATAIFENSIYRQKLNAESLESHYKLLQKYVDNNQSYELQCLFALQSLSQKLEHPQGLLLSICERLYDDTLISQDSFVAWEICSDPAEQEGKGVALKQLTSFFTQLKENEESGTSSDEAA